MYRLNVLLIVTVVVLFSQFAVALENPMLVRVDFIEKSDLKTLKQLHLDVPYICEDFADVVAYSDDLTSIINAGLHYQVVHDDLVGFYQSRNPLTMTMGGFLTFTEIIDSMDAIHDRFPTLVSARDSIGTSWEGRTLWVYKISDNVDIDEDEPEIFYNSLIHAREPASWSWQNYYIDWLLTNYGMDSVATTIIDERELYFLPVFNPDGYVYNEQIEPNGGGMWRKNRRPGGYGVDLNRNWGYMWGYDDNGSSPYPDDQTYRGPEAFSEPETQAVRDFIESRDFQLILNAHTYGDFFLYPYGYENIYTPDQDIYQVLGDSAEALTGYNAGTAWELLYNVNGDACDWQYGEHQIFTCVTETGNYSDGFWPSPYRIPQLNEQMFPLAVYISQIGGNVRSVAPPQPPVLNPIGEVQTDSFTVSWTHTDEHNPAVAYELVEKTGYSRFTDDLESGTDYWQLDGFTLSTSRYHSYNHSLFSGNYNSSHNKAIMAELFTVEQGDTLVFYTWYDIEIYYDYGYVELSTDGGSVYTTIPGSITSNYNPNGNNRGNGITGSSSGWIEAKFPLDDYVGMVVLIKFSYLTDGYVSNPGMYIDDIYPIEGFSQVQVISSDITGNSYLIEDRSDGTYYYQAKAKDIEDQWSGFSNRIDVVVTGQSGISDDAVVPSEFALRQNYPNPFNAQTTISFSLASPGNIKLEIYDIAGRLVNTLIDSKLSAGNHQVIWDGRNNYDDNTASGVYFYKLTTAEKSSTYRMVLLK